MSMIMCKYGCLSDTDEFVEFGYDEELIDLASKNNNVVFEGSISRPTEDKNRDWKGLEGRINNLVLGKMEEWGINPSESIVYACGHPGMIEDVKEKLENTEYTFLEERFWKD